MDWIKAILTAIGIIVIAFIMYLGVLLAYIFPILGYLYLDWSVHYLWLFVVSLPLGMIANGIAKIVMTVTLAGWK